MGWGDPRDPTLRSLLPNTLTVLRLAIAAGFPFSPHGWRLGLVLVGAVSDALDGFFARKLHAESWIGALLDGIADKLFTLSVLLTLAADGVFGWPFLVALLARDIVNALIALQVAITGPWSLFRRVSARVSGKVTTAAIFLMLVVILWRPDVGEPLVWLAAATSVITAADYAVVFYRWTVLKIEPTHLTPDE